jgi:hypothetical protein
VFFSRFSGKPFYCNSNPANEMVTMDSPDSGDGSQAKDRGSGKKKKNLTLGSFKSPFKFLGKTYCKGCRKKCSGEVPKSLNFFFASSFAFWENELDVFSLVFSSQSKIIMSQTNGLYYKHITIVNDDSSIINK